MIGFGGEESNSMTHIKLTESWIFFFFLMLFYHSDLMLSRGNSFFIKIEREQTLHENSQKLYFEPFLGTD